MKIGIVFTTIYVPNIVSGYADNFNEYGHADDIEIIIIGDRKTPKEAENVVSRASAAGLKVDFWDIERQEKWLGRFADLKRIIPYNSDNRRNIGFLIAYQKGCETIISIDDDNFAYPESDFIGGHKIIGKDVELKTVSSDNGWFNICSLLETSPKRLIYPRGFPFSKRGKDSAQYSITRGKVMLNAGLWLNDPDVDAVSRLNERVKAVKVLSDPIMLDRYVKSPINTQNTSLHRELISCYYYISMDASIGGIKLDRYGDIWSGFFAKKIADHMDFRVSLGSPIVVHNRTPHNLLKDLKEEFWGMTLTEELVEILEEIKLSESKCGEAYVELGQLLFEEVNKNVEFPNEAKEYFKGLKENMKIWVDTCAVITGGF